MSTTKVQVGHPHPHDDNYELFMCGDAMDYLRDLLHDELLDHPDDSGIADLYNAIAGALNTESHVSGEADRG